MFQNLYRPVGCSRCEAQIPRTLRLSAPKEHFKTAEPKPNLTHQRKGHTGHCAAEFEPRLNFVDHPERGELDGGQLYDCLSMYIPWAILCDAAISFQRLSICRPLAACLPTAFEETLFPETT